MSTTVDVKKEVCFTIAGKHFYPGDTIYGTILNEQIEGKLQKENNALYFCQDLKFGQDCKDKLGYEASWVFNVNKSTTEESLLAFTDGVVIFKDESFYTPPPELEVVRTSNSLEIKRKGNVSFNFNYKEYQDCCGSTLCHNFNVWNDVKVKELLDTLKKDYPKDFAKIEKVFSKTTNCNAILREKFQTKEIEFLKYFGFEKVSEFVNSNTNNLLGFYIKNND